MNNRKLIAEALLEIASNSVTEFIEDSKIDKELIDAAKKIGIVLPSPDLAVFKTTYAEIDKVNKNGVTLPRKAVKEGLNTLIGKNCNWEHSGSGYICGYTIKAEIDEDKIQTINVLFKSLFPDQIDELKEKIKTKEASVSFEIWNKDPNTGKSVVKELDNGYREINPIIFHGTGVLLLHKPACPTAKIFKLVAKNLTDATTKELNKIFSPDLIYAGLALEETEEASYECQCLKCGKIVISEKHCKDIKCPECGGDMRRKDKPGQGQPTTKSNKVKVEIKQIDSTVWICPHCDKEIGEKELFYDEQNQKWYHRPCKEKGEIILPKDNKEEIRVDLKNLFANVTKEEEITFDLAMAFYYSSNEEKATLTEDAAKWTKKFINDLPDSAFAAIEPAYPEKTQDKNARHLPHHNGEGDLGKEKSNANLDLPHYKNALARCNQIDPISDSISADDLRKKAQNHLNRHKDALEQSSAETKPKVKPEETQPVNSGAETKPVNTEGKETTEAQPGAPLEVIEPKIIVKVTTENREVRVSTYVDGTPSGTDEIKGYYKKTTEYKDGTKDEVEEETKVEKKYTYSELEEAVNKAKKELEDLHKAELETKINEVKVDLEKKIGEKEIEISNLKKELEKKSQEQAAEVNPEGTEASLEVGNVAEVESVDKKETKDRAKEIDAIIAKKHNK